MAEPRVATKDEIAATWQQYIEWMAGAWSARTGLVGTMVHGEGLTCAGRHYQAASLAKGTKRLPDRLHGYALHAAQQWARITDGRDPMQTVLTLEEMADGSLAIYIVPMKPTTRDYLDRQYPGASA